MQINTNFVKVLRVGGKEGEKSQPGAAKRTNLIFGEA